MINGQDILSDFLSLLMKMKGLPFFFKQLIGIKNCLEEEDFSKASEKIWREDS